MGLFKNEVGRPSNDTLRKRKIAIAAMVIGVAAVVGFGGLYVVKFRNTSAINSNSKNISTDQIKKNLKCKSSDTPIIDGNYAYCRSKKANCPDAYPFDEGNRCYQRGCNGKGTYNKSTQKCEYANPNYPCDKGYTYNRNLRKCLKEDLSAYDETIRYDCPSGYSVWKASNGVPYCAKYMTASFKYYCPSGATKAGDGPNAYCLTSKKVNEYKKATAKTTYTCPKYYSKIPGTQTNCQRRLNGKTVYAVANKNVSYTCPKGYKTVPGTKSNCYKTKTVSTKSSILKTVNCPKGWGVSDAKKGVCYQLGSGRPKVVVVNYWCKSGYYKANETCYKQVNPNSSKLTHTNFSRTYYSRTVDYVYNKYNMTKIK